jgi:hypothetical protein
LCLDDFQKEFNRQKEKMMKKYEKRGMLTPAMKLVLQSDETLLRKVYKRTFCEMQTEKITPLT